MNTRPLRKTCAAALVLAASFACDPTEESGDAGAGGVGGVGGAGGGGGGGGAVDENPIPEDDVAISVASTCLYGEQTLADQVAVDAVERCLYRRSSHLLNVRLRGENAFVQVVIVGFTGTGDYTTGDTEDATSVTMDGPDQDADDPGLIFSWAGETRPAARCDLVVTRTNLPEVELVAEQPAFGYVGLQATCLQLNGAAVTDYACDLAPVDFEFGVARCEVSAD